MHTPEQVGPTIARGNSTGFLRRSGVVPYLAALAAPALALLLTLSLAGIMEGGRPPLAFFYLAVVAAAWYGGIGPGLTAAVLSFVLADYFVFAPLHAFVLSAQSLIALVAFAAVALPVSYMTGSLQRAQRRAESARAASDSLALRLADAQRLAHVGSWEWDLAANRLTWSAELFRIFGLDPRRVRPTLEEYLERIHPDDRERARHRIDAALKTGESMELELRIVRPDGAERMLRSRSEVLPGPGGEPAHMVGICVDVTVERMAEARALEVARAESARAAAEAAAARQEFLARASAEIGATLEMDALLKAVVRQAMPMLGDWVGITILENGRLRRVVLESANASDADAAQRLKSFLSDPHDHHAVARAIRTGETQVGHLADGTLAAGAGEELRLLRRMGVRSYVVVPLAAAGQVFGAFGCAYAESGRTHGPADVALVEELARRVAVAYHNAALIGEREAARAELEARAAELREREARLTRALQALAVTTDEAENARAVADRAVHRLEAVADIAQAVLRRGTLDEVLTELLDRVRGHLGAEEASLLLADETGSLGVRASRGIDDDAMRGVRIPFGRGIAGRVAATRRPLIVSDTADMEVFSEHLRRSVRSLVAVPLLIDGNVLGVIHVGTAQQRAFTPEDRAFLELVAERVASIIERARLHDAEREARADAEAANRGKSQFLATMSHDLRTPLNAIGGYAQLLGMGVLGELSERQREAVARIEQNQERALRLMSELLDFARIEAKHVQYHLDDVALHPVLAALEATIAPQVREKRLTYHYAPCDARLGVRADREKLEQVLLNLLTNAVKFTDAGGRVEVEVDPGDERVAIQVRDTGRGIPPEKLTSIFEPFVQVGSERREGVGLGLAIGRQFARGMHGDITVESTPGRGSSFTVWLPRCGHCAPAPPSPVDRST